MSLGAGALIARSSIVDPAAIRVPFLAMVVLMAVALGLSIRRDQLGSADARVLAIRYPIFVMLALTS